MQRAAITKLPSGLLYLEGCGGVMIILALIIANQASGWFGIRHPQLVAIILLLMGFILMLPAVIMLSFRTVNAMAPQLFGKSTKKKS